MSVFRALLFVLLSGLLSACGNMTNSLQFLGYVEGDFILVGADENGRLETLAVKEGDTIAKGEPLFTLEMDREKASLAEAEARLKQTEATLSLSKVSLERAKRLFKQGHVSSSTLDDAQSTFDANTAAAAAARAAVEDARTRLARRHVAAPATGVVQQIYFRPGEIVSAGQPVVSILPPENVKIRFYIPEPARSTMKIGEIVQVSCDGCQPGLTAKINFFSNEAEYTPPVIFSREERSKLLYMVEARPDAEARKLGVGQPVTVSVSHQEQATGP